MSSVLLTRKLCLVIGQRNAGDVDFLEGVRAEHFAGDIAGDADHRDGIEHGGGDAGDEVGCAGTAGGHGNAHFAGGARVAVGHVRGALLVADKDVVDGKFAQRIVNGKNCSARVPEYIGYTFAYECRPHDFRAGEPGGRGEVLLGGLRFELFPMGNSLSELRYWFRYMWLRLARQWLRGRHTCEIRHLASAMPGA